MNAVLGTTAVFQPQGDLCSRLLSIWTHGSGIYHGRRRPAMASSGTGTVALT